MVQANPVSINPAHHMGLVHDFVNRLHLPPWVDREDLINEGYLGLDEAAKRFDPARGWQFSTLAPFHIRRAVIGYLRREDRDMPFGRRDDAVLLDMPDESPEEAAANEKRRQVVSVMLRDLPAEVRRLIWARLVEGVRVRDLAAAYALDPREVSRIVCQAVKTLVERHGANVKELLASW